MRSSTVAGQVDCGGVETPVSKHAGAEAHDFPVHMDRSHAAKRIHVRNQQTDGVAADVDGGVPGHPIHASGQT